MPTFVIHEHHSTHLHYDFRLESGGALKSWALPKDPPRAKGAKRLAIQVEDHPLSYAKFEGEIKQGYGKGIVKIWDNGNYSLEEKTPKKIVFNLQGKRIKGRYVLLKTEFGGKKDTWLLMKL
jgi:DNA ligase D-like protein (predicted 3'-phosphoesterase)